MHFENASAPVAALPPPLAFPAVRVAVWFVDRVRVVPDVDVDMSAWVVVVDCFAAAPQPANSAAPINAAAQRLQIRLQIWRPNGPTRSRR